MKTYSIILILNLLSLANSATNQTALELDDIPEGEVQTRTTDYEVDLTEYCPNAPSNEAGQCVASYNLSQNVEQVLVESMVNVDYRGTQYNKVLQLTKCSIDRVPKLTFDLQIFCYFKGVREFLLEEFQSVKTQAEFDELMVELGKLINDEERPDFKDFYQQLYETLEIKHSFAAAQNEVLNDKTTLVTDDMDKVLDETKIPRVPLKKPGSNNNDKQARLAKAKAKAKAEKAKAEKAKAEKAKAEKAKAKAKAEKEKAIAIAKAKAKAKAKAEKEKAIAKAKAKAEKEKAIAKAKAKAEMTNKPSTGRKYKGGRYTGGRYKGGR